MEALAYTRELVAFDTTSRLSNASVSAYLEEVLRRLGCATERLEYRDAAGVLKVNVVGKRGSGQGGLALCGHTDVVPVEDWTGPGPGPFAGVVVGGRLYGRGSCDMKGSLACMLAAAERLQTRPHRAPLYLVFTADEEIGYAGAATVAAQSRLFREMIASQTRTVVGEPTNLEVVHAHKGTYALKAVSRGRAAHSSTRAGRNANLAMIPFLVEMKQIHDDLEADPAWQHHDFDPPTVSWNIGINDHNPAMNITAPQSVCTIYFRPMPGQDAERLLQRAAAVAQRCGIEFEVLYRGAAMYVDPQSEFIGELLELTGTSRARTVAYGTDASQFTGLRHMAILGPGDIAQAHTADEWISVEQLARGTALYERLMERWCC